MDEQYSVILNSTVTSPKTTTELPTQVYFDSLFENNRNRRDVSTALNDQDYDCANNKLMNLDSKSVKGDPNSDKKLANKNENDDKIDQRTLIRFNQALENYPRISTEDGVFNLKQINKYITDITVFKHPNQGGYSLRK